MENEKKELIEISKESELKLKNEREGNADQRIRKEFTNDLNFEEMDSGKKLRKIEEAWNFKYQLIKLIPELKKNIEYLKISVQNSSQRINNYDEIQNHLDSVKELRDCFFSIEECRRLSSILEQKVKNALNSAHENDLESINEIIANIDKREKNTDKDSEEKNDNDDNELF